MLSLKAISKRCANRALSPLGYELRRKAGDQTDKADGFSQYLSEATKLGIDVNDWEEQQLGWAPGLPILQETVLPYLRDDSIVCNLGPGTGRWARHIAPRLSRGELHLVDYSPWMVDFLRQYFHDNPRVHVHLNDGYSLRWHASWTDLVFSFGTFIALKLGHIYLYSREFFRVLKPDGYCAIEYINVTSPEGWNWLETQANRSFADCYTYHAPESVQKVFCSAGFRVVKHVQIGRGAFLVLQKPSTPPPADGPNPE